MSDDLRGKTWPVLDHGYVQLCDWMGSDADICAAARVSYGEGTRSVSDDRTLIRHLMRHRHSTPFEMAEIKLRVQVPMDVWRQWIRHRTANVNEYSTRYSEAIDLMHVTAPEGWRLQATGNKQGSAGMLSPEIDGIDGTDWCGADLSDFEANFHTVARNVYRARLRVGVAREQARKDLPLSTYTRAYWKCDLRNLLHFLSLRMAPEAQQEIRSYADVIGREIVATLFPLTWEAFQDYTFNALTLSALDIVAIRTGSLDHFTSSREREECRAKLAILDLPDGSQAATTDHRKV